MLYIYLSMKVPKVKFIIIFIIILFKNTVNTSGINKLQLNTKLCIQINLLSFKILLTIKEK